MPPARDTSPYVGRMPVSPQNADGHRIEPHVSVPSANVASPPATAAPEPEDEPPVHRLGSHGLRPGPVADAFANRQPRPPANSTMAALPSRIAPAASSRSTTVAFSLGTRSRRNFVPHAVGTSFVSNRSFAAYGMPCSGPFQRFACSSLTARAAWSSARSRVTRSYRSEARRVGQGGG